MERDLSFVLVNVSFRNFNVSTLGIIRDGKCLAMDCFGSKPVVRYYNVSSTLIRNIFQLDDEIFKVLIFAKPLCKMLDDARSASLSNDAGSTGHRRVR